MSHVLLISRSRKFESRLRGLVGPDLNAIMGSSIAKGTPAVLARLGAGDAPDVALLGPALSYAQAYELSIGLSAMYPRTRILLVREPSNWDTEKWMSRMKVHGLASPGLTDGALVKAVEGEVSDPPDFRIDVEAPAPPSTPDVPVETAQPELLPEVDVDARLGGQVEQAPGEFAEDHELSTAIPGPYLDTDAWAAPNEDAADLTEAPLAEPAPAYRGQIIAVVSPKGGMGKTTVATNLAVGLTKIAPNSVVLIDADVQFGDVATALALNPQYALPDAVSDAAARDEMVLKAYLTSHPSGLYTVCGSPSPVEGDRVTGEQLAHLISQLAGFFRFVIIDTAPGLGEHTLAALEQANDVVALCGMSVTSARGLRKHLEVLHGIGIMPAQRHVVLNFADRVSGLSVRDVEATTGVPMDVAIPRSKQVVLSSNRGIPVIAEKHRNPTSKAFLQLVSRFDPSAVRNSARHLRTVALK